MGYVRIFARAVSNTGPQDYSFDDINDMPFYHSAICADSRVLKGIICMSSVGVVTTGQYHTMQQLVSSNVNSRREVRSAI